MEGLLLPFVLSPSFGNSMLWIVVFLINIQCQILNCRRLVWLLLDVIMIFLSIAQSIN